VFAERYGMREKCVYGLALLGIRKATWFERVR
jgi:hypothetical protein